jgi:glycosyltransferase involved in cell wall biosynthesis
VSVSVVIPTITGREALCERTVAGLRATVPADELQVIVVRERPCIGRAWNDGAEAADGEYVMLAADDIVPHPGWYEACVEATSRGCYPAPRIEHLDGSVLATGSMGGGWLLTGCADWAPVASSQFPFIRRYWWREMGPCLDIHYFADDYLAARARACGINVAYREGYRLSHLEGTEGRAEMVNRSMTDRLTFENAMSQPVWDVAVSA